MTPPRFYDYANITPSQIKRLLHEDGTPPARIIFCCMAQLPFSGRLDLENDEVPNTRNRVVEVVESVYLMVLRSTIPGNQLYGDVRSMSAKEFVQWLKQRGTGQGLGFFRNGVGRKKSNQLGRKKSNSTEENSASGGGVGVGAPGMAHPNSTKTGACANFRDSLDPAKLAKFHFYYKKGRGDNEEIFECIEGCLWWDPNGYLRTSLNGDDAIEFNGEERKKNQVNPSVATHLPIKYIPSDDSDPVELGTVLGGDFEKFYPKPSTWVRMSGIPREFDDLDVEDVLEKALEIEEDESIVLVERSGGGYFVDVQFAKVWEARDVKFSWMGTRSCLERRLASSSCTRLLYLAL